MARYVFYHFNPQRHVLLSVEDGTLNMLGKQKHFRLCAVLPL